MILFPGGDLSATPGEGRGDLPGAAAGLVFPTMLLRALPRPLPRRPPPRGRFAIICRQLVVGMRI